MTIIKPKKPNIHQVDKSNQKDLLSFCCATSLIKLFFECYCQK